MKKLAISIGVIITMISCEKKLDFKGEVKEPKIVTNCIFNPEEDWNVHVSRSLSSVDNGDIYAIPPATVNIYNSGGSLVESLSQVPDDINTYESTLGNKPAGNEAYRIEVGMTGYETVTGESFVPAAIDPIVSYTSSGGDYQTQLNVVLEDHDPSQTNYYAISAMEIAYIDGTDTTWHDEAYAVWMSTDQDVFDLQYGDILTFKDQTFQGGRINLKVNLNMWNDGLFKYYVHTLTEEAYNYLRTTQAYQDATGNPFAQPVQVFSNIDKGFGVFAGEQKFGRYVIN